MTYARQKGTKRKIGNSLLPIGIHGFLCLSQVEQFNDPCQNPMMDKEAIKPTRQQ
jgi:hypothetical protein